MKKLVPDPLLPGQFRTPEHDLATQRIRLALAANTAETSILGNLKATAPASAPKRPWCMCRYYWIARYRSATRSANAPAVWSAG